MYFILLFWYIAWVLIVFLNIVTKIIAEMVWSDNQQMKLFQKNL